MVSIFFQIPMKKHRIPCHVSGWWQKEWFWNNPLAHLRVFPNKMEDRYEVSSPWRTKWHMKGAVLYCMYCNVGAHYQYFNVINKSDLRWKHLQPSWDHFREYHSHRNRELDLRNPPVQRCTMHGKYEVSTPSWQQHRLPIQTHWAFRLFSDFHERLQVFGNTVDRPEQEFFPRSRCRTGCVTPDKRTWWTREAVYH